MLAYFNTAYPVEHYRPLPRLHAGRPALLTFSRRSEQPDERLVLRLWVSDFTTTVSGRTYPILLGGLVTEQLPLRQSIRLVQTRGPSSQQKRLSPCHSIRGPDPGDGSCGSDISAGQQNKVLLVYPATRTYKDGFVSAPQPV
ncbi:MAG: hypothetical protein R3F53_20105 [Gammaproteobacteria bacterium]